MFKYRFTHSLTRIPQSLMIILCIIGITIAGFLPTQMVSAEGNTLYVSSSGTDDGSCGGESSPCATIAQAITNSTAGDIIIVGEGIFFPPTATSISIDKNLTIRGQGAANTMVYRTGSERRIFDISGSSVSVTLEDLTIWNGAATGDSGGGIKVSGGASLSLDSVTVKDNHAASGAGVYLEGGGNLSVNNSTFTGNVATGNGGAIYMSGAGTMTVTSSIFGGSSDTKNQAVNGAAIYQVDSDGSISGGTFSYNAASGSGGAVYLTGSSASLAISDSAEFKSNTVSSNGAAFYLASGALETSGDVVISSNTATVNGGGIYQAGGTVSLTDTTLSSNGAVLGAGIYQQAGTLDILRSTLNANTASTSGAGLYLASASGANSLSNTTLSGNTANGTGTTDGGGAIYKTGASTLSFDSVTIAYNTAARNANSGVRVASTSGTVTALNSLFYFNGSGTTHANCSGTVYASGDTNLDSGATCGFSSERSNKDPQLGALADNGGYTYTHALPYLSGENPAIDSGSTDLLTDQRGKTRPDGSSPDVGAFEFQRPAISLNTTGALSYTELDAATQIAPAATYSDDVSSFTSGDVLTVTLTDAQTGDVLGIKTTSKIQVIQSSGSYYVLYDGSTNIGAVTGAKYQVTPDSSPLVISFNSNASRLAIEYLIKAITFENTQINPSETSRSVSFVIEHGGVDSESVSRDISISNPNLPPLAKNVSITIDENEIYTDTNFAGSDHYNDPDQHSLYGIIVIQMPAHGSLTVNGASVIVDTIMPVGSGDVVYTPDSDYFGYDSFQWKAVDNGDESNPGSDRKTSTSSATYSITIIAVNDAPTTNGQTTKALAAISEDATAPAGETVANLITSAPSAYYDADDDGLAGIAVVANAATSAQGVWQFSTDSGSTWTDLPGGIGSEIDDTNALVLESAGMLRFLPAANWNGAPGSLILRVWDGTAGQLSGPAGTLRDISDLVGGSGAYSSEIVALTTQVSAVNDDPTEVLLSPTEVTENLPIGTVVATISADDVDLITNPGTETMVYTLGGVDAAKFSISGDELLTAEMFDYETTASYAITIQAEDSASSTVVTPFTITVVDDVLTVSVANTTGGPGTANEKDTPEDGQFTLSLEKSYPYALTVNYTTTTSTANAFDYELLDGETPIDGTVTFSPNQTSKDITVKILNDDVVEGDESVVMTLTGTDDVDVTVASSPDDTATITVTDDDTSAASITANVSTAVEGGDDGQFTVSLTKLSKTDTTITYSISGTAINGTDYTSLGSGDPLTGTAIILANTSTTTIDVEALTDTLVEGTQTVVLTLTATDNPSISAGGSDTVSIQDADSGTISIEGTTNASEPSTSGLFTVNVSPTSEYDVSVELSSPPSPTDYQALPVSITIPAGQSSATFPVYVINDSYDEYDEPLTVTLGTISGHGDSSFNLGTSEDSILILDDDALPKISINDVTVDPEGADETTTTAHFTISLDRGTEKLLRINYSTEDNTAVSGLDYLSLSDTHTFITSTHQTSFAFDVTVNGDDLVEGNETFDVDLLLVDSLNGIINKGVGVATIVDDDVAEASITASTATTNEGSETPGQFTVELTKAAQIPVVITYTVGGTATAGSDFIALAGQITIPANTLSAPIDVSSTTDEVVEGDETVLVTLTQTDNGRVSIGSSTSASVTIVDDDWAEVSVNASTPSTIEGSGTPGTFTISLDKQTQIGVTITYTISGSADSGIDFTPVSESISIPASTSSVDIDVASISDDMVEGDETVILTLTSTDYSRVSLGEDKEATVTITDDDMAEISVTASQDLAAENGSGSPTNGEYTISMTNPARADVTVDVTLGGTATNGTDYVNIASSATIPAGSTSTKIDLVVTEDDLVEGDETAILTISNPQPGGGLNRNLFSIPKATEEALVTITDDDTATLTLEATSTPAAEGDVNGEFTIRATHPSEAPVEIGYSISGSAANGTDYSDGESPLSGSVILPANQTSITIPIVVVDDTLVEGSEAVTLTLTSPLEGRVVIDSGSAGTASVEIQDNDQALISITKLNDTGEEGNPESFLISLDKPSQADLPITFSIGGTADASGLYQDYSLSSSDAVLAGTVITIPGGSSSAHLTVTPVNDEIVEGGETVIVTLTAPTTGLVVVDEDNDTATMNLSDNDTATLTIASSGSPAEGGETGAFTISTSKISQAAVVIGYSISGTATNGTDYTSGGGALSGSVTLPAYTSSVEIPIAIVDDALVEVSESIALTLTSPDSGLVQVDTGSGKTASLSVLDNDTATITVVKSSNAAEGGSSGIFTVSVTKASQAAVAVTFGIGGSATTADDYSLSSPDAQSLTDNIVTLAPGALSAHIYVNPVDDNLVEGTENVVLMLTDPKEGTVKVGSPNTAMMDITDNDTATISIAQKANATEDGAEGQFEITATKPSAIDVTLTFSVGGSADKDGAHQDFSLTSTNETLAETSITLPAGETTTTIDVEAVDDAVVENTEDVIISLTSSSSGLAPIATGEGSTATVTIADNDNAVVSIESSVASIAESEAGMVFTVTVTQASQQALTVTYTPSGEAANGEDYNQSSALSGSVVIPGYGTQTTIELNPYQDEVVEGNETATLTLDDTDFDKVTVASDGSQTASVTITDDDEAEISIEATQANAAENGEGDPADGEYTVSMSKAARADVTVDVAISGTATNGTDYTTILTETTITAGQTTQTIALEVKEDEVVEGDETATLTISNPQPGGGLSSSMFSILGATDEATVTIMDDDTASLTLEATSTPAAEGDVNGEFTIRATHPSQAPVEIGYSISGSAANGTDYSDGESPLSGSVTLPADQTSITIPIVVVDDTLVEGSEAVTLTLTSPLVGRVVIDSGSAGKASVEIQDNDQALISITKLNDTGEDGSPESFLISLDKPSQADLPITFSIGGTADASGLYQDYSLSSSDAVLAGTVITIPGGSSSAHLTVTPVDDEIVEGSETVIVTLTAPTTGLVVVDEDNAAATMNLSDNDTATLTIASSGSPAEGGGTGTFTISTSKISQAAVVIGYSIGGTATNGTDYTSGGGALSGSVTLPAYTSSVEIPIAIVDDALVEVSESIALTLMSPDSGLVQVDTGSGKTASLSVTDNDTATITVVKSSNAAEGGSSGIFTVSVTKASQAAVAVTFGIGGSATTADDYSLSSPDAQSLTDNIVTLAPGALSAHIYVNPVDDNLVEGTENVVLMLTDPKEGTVKVGSPNTAMMDITDNDTATISIAQKASATEGGAEGQFEITATKPSAIDVTLTFSVGGSADKDGAHQDFSLTSTNETLAETSITLPAGETTTTIDVEAVDDTVVENTEDVIISLTSSSSGLASIATGEGSTATVTIADNDNAVVSIESSVASIAESEAGMVFTVTVTQASQQALTIHYTPSGEAVNGEDYNQSNSLSGSVVIPGYGTQTTIELNPYQDEVVEGNETATLTLDDTDFDKVTVASDGSQTASVTITDDDEAEISIEATQANAAENGEGDPTDGEYTVTMSKAARADVTVDVAISGTAVNGTDYTTILTATTIEAGETSKVIGLDVSEDAIVEGDETVILTISNPQPGGGLSSGLFSISDTDEATVTIADDDIAVVSLSKVSDGAEPDSDGQFRVSVDKVSQADVTVNYEVDVESTATAGSDYTTLSGSVIIVAGQSSADITVEVWDDSIAENDESVIVNLLNTSSLRVSVGASSTATVNITSEDDDPLISVSGVEVEEGTGGESTATFTVTMDRDSQKGVSVNYATQDGSAVQPDDYTQTSGSLTLGNGDLSETVDVIIQGDSVVEGDETFSLVLSGAVNATLPNGEETLSVDGTITDDDEAVVSIAKTAEGSEPSTNGQFSVSMSNPAQVDTTVEYSVSGTATAGSDYTSLSGEVVIAAGQTSQTLEVAVKDDDIAENSETVVVTLTGVSGLVELDGTPANRTATLNIADNEADPTISINDVSVTEGDSGTKEAEFAVTLSHKSEKGITVQYWTSNGTAITPGDYQSTSGTLSFGSTEVTKSITVNVVGDELVEVDKSYSVVLESPSHATLDKGVGTGTIVENDTATVSIAKSGDAAEEGLDAGEFTVTLTKLVESAVVVNYNVGGTATGGTDYTNLSGSVTIPAKTSTAQIGVTPQQDDMVEGTETVEVTLSGTDNSRVTVDTLPSNQTASVSITDNDNAVVGVTATVNTTEEGSLSAGQYTITMTKEAQSAVIVYYDVTGSATPGSDYTSLGSSVTIPAGSKSVTVDVASIEDEIVEGSEDVTLTLSGTNNANVTVDPVEEYQSATVSITDDDEAEISIEATQANAAENGEGDPTDGEYTVTMSKAARADVTVDVAISGTAVNGTDYTTILTATTIEAGETSKVIGLDVSEDAIVEGDETATLTISNPQPEGGLSSGLFSISDTDEATVTITDDDVAEASIVWVSDGAEPDTDGQFRVSVDKVSQADVTVNYAVDGSSTATAGSDYTALSGSVTIQALQNSADITVEVLDDSIAENDESVIVNLLSTSSLRVSVDTENDTATVNITSEDADPLISVSEVEVEEGTGGESTATFTVTMNRDSQKGVSVNYATQDGSAVQPYDYTSTSGSLTLGNGDLSETVDVIIQGDSVVEGDETFSLVLSGAVNATLSNEQPTLSVDGTIRDDDEAVVSITKTAEGSEPSTNGQFSVSMSNPAQVATTISYNVSGTATAESDYTSLSGEVVIAAGQTSQTLEVAVKDDDIAENSETVVVTLTGVSGLVELDGTPANRTATLNIADNEADPTISINDVSVTEGDSGTKEAEFTVTLSHKSEKGITVQYWTSNGTAITPGDYQSTSGTLSFGSTEVTKSITVNVVGDELVEVDKSYSVVLVNPSHATLNKGVGAGTIVENDTATVSIAKSGDAAEEGLDAGEFTVTLTKLVESDVVVNYNVGGTATGGTDYTELSGSVTIPAKTSTAQIEVTPQQDDMVEGTETVEVTLSGTNNSRVTVDTLPGHQTASVSIADNDNAVVSISASPFSTSEGGSTPGTFTLTLDELVQPSVVVSYDVSGSATPPSDYIALSGTVVIPAQTASINIDISAIDDDIVEGEENLILTLTGTNNDNVSVVSDAGKTATITFDDNDTSEISIEATQANAAENGEGDPTDGEYTVTMSKAARADVTVDVAISGTAVNGTDYTTILTETTIEAGETSKVIGLDVSEDAIVEGDETVILTISNPQPEGGLSSGLFSISDTDEATVTITDDDIAVVSLSKESDGAEPNSDGQFLISVDKVSQADVTVNYEVDGSSTATAGFDYTALSGSVIIVAGQSSADITVDVLDDSIAENDETVKLNLTGTDSERVSIGEENNTATVNITSEDADPLISVSGVEVEEGTGGESTATFTVTMDIDSQKGVSVSYATLNGSAVQPDDYTQTSGSLTLGNGDLSETVDVIIQGDSVVEGDETFSLVLSEAVNATLSNEQPTLSVDGTIRDDDEAVVSITKAADGAEPSTNGQFSVTMSNPAQVDTTVSYEVSGTATAGSDYTSLSGEVVIAAGQTSQTLEVAVIDDNISEFSETVEGALTEVSASAGQFEISSEQGSASVSITDNEANPKISIQSVSGSENAGSFTFDVNLDRPSEKGVSVKYASGGIEATPNVDFTTVLGTLSFSSVQTQLPITVTITNDSQIEGDETFSIVLSEPEDAEFSNSAAIGTIEDDDFATISVEKTDDAVEDGTDGKFTVSMDNSISQDIQVSYLVDVTSTATGGTDYTALSGTVTIPSGQLSATIDVEVILDNLVEGDETIQITLTSVNSSLAHITDVLANKTATLTIADNDQAVISVGDTPVNAAEPSTDGKFTINLSNPTQAALDVTYSITGTATPDVDYTALSGTATIPALGSSVDVDVDVIDDSLAEDAETVILTLTGPINSLYSVDTTPATVTISDDDLNPTASVNDPQITEGDSGTSTMTFTVTLSSASAKTGTVEYTLVDDSATAGSDYQSTSGTLTFYPGDTEKTVDVSVIGDTIAEGDETFNLELSNGTNMTIVDNIGVGTILDDDIATVSVEMTSDAKEDSTDGQFTVSVDKEIDEAVQVSYSVDVTSTADSGTDYTALSGTVTIPSGDLSATIDVEVITDSLVEGDETIQITLTEVDSSLARITDVSGDKTATLTIADNDQAVISVGDTPVNAAEPSTDGKFTINLSNPTQAALDVTYSITGTATSGVDYTVLSGTATIPALGSSVDVDVDVMDDSLAEDAETVILTLTGPINSLYSVDTTPATVTISDDDLNPTASVNDPQITEGDSGSSTMTFTVTLSSASAKTGTVEYTLVDDSATAGSDYQSTSGTLTFAPGETEKTVEVVIFGDLIKEAHETFSLVLSNGVNITIGDDTGVGTILDNDTCEVSIDSVSKAEGDTGETNFEFTVSLNPASSETVTVDYATSDGSATAGSDYTAASGILTFEPMEVSKTITVKVSGDTLYEDDETFLVTLSNISANANLSLTAYQGTGTIQNDENQPILSIGSVEQNEGSSGPNAFDFTVSLNPANESEVTVDFTTEDGTATSSGGDYTTKSGMLTFAGGETTQTISISVNGDRLVEFDEDFLVRLSSPTNAIFSGGAPSITGTGTIKNDDHAPTLSSSISKSVDEDNTLTFTRNDFTGAYSDADSDALANITILSLPAQGVLKLNSTPITVNQVILAANLGNISYTPAKDYFGSDTFNWTASDGVNSAVSPSRVDITIHSVNDPPTLDEIGDIELIRSASSQVIPLTGISAGGDGDLSDLDVTAISDNPPVLPHPSAAYNSGSNTWSITLNPTSVAGTANVTVTIDDHGGTNNILTRTFSVTIENPSLEISPTNNLLTDENGRTANFTVMLGIKPLGNVTLTVSSTDIGEGTAAPTSLVFTPDNWNTPQSVTVTGVDDDILDGDISYQITLDASGSNDTEYSTMSIYTIEVVNRDNELPITNWLVYLPLMVK